MSCPLWNPGCAFPLYWYTQMGHKVSQKRRFPVPCCSFLSGWSDCFLLWDQESKWGPELHFAVTLWMDLTSNIISRNEFLLKMCASS